MANDNGQIVLGLDIPKTKEQINKDIASLQSKLNKAQITGELDEKTLGELNEKIKTLKLNKIKLGIEIDDKDISKSLDSSQSKNAASKAGEQIGNNVTQGIKKAVGNATKSFSELTSFTKLNSKVKPFVFDTSELKNYQEILSAIKKQYSEFGQVKITNQSFDNGVLEKFKVNIEQVNGDLKETKSFMMSLSENDSAFIPSNIITGSENIVQHLDKTKNAVNQTAEAINALKNKTKADSLKLNFGDFGTTTTNITNLIGKFEQLQNLSKETKERITSLKSALSTMNTQTIVTGSDTDIIEQNDKIIRSYKQLSNEYKQITSDARLYATEQQRLSLANSIESFMQKNSKMTLSARLELESYVKELTNMDVAMTKVAKNDISNAFKATTNELRGLGKLGASIKDQFSQAATSFTQWLSVSSGVMALVYQLQKIPKEVYEIDTAMTNLYKVTDETDSKYDSFLSSATDKAKELGRSVSSLVEQTSNWAKLGYSIDDAASLAETSSIYANVGEVDDETAVSDIVTAMKAFNIEATDSIEIIDKLNALGNQYAVSSADLGTGLSNSASALALAGNSIDESLAMITAMSEVTQDASESGNALKILSMRVRGYDEETESYTGDVEELTGAIADLTKTASTSGGISLFTDDTKTTYKSTYQLLSEISEVWDQLTDKNQAELLEKLAGKQRGNSIAALLTNMAQANKALDSSLNSSGSAQQEQERWLDSMEAKTQQLEAAFQSLSNTALNSDFLKNIIDLGTNTVEVFDKIIDKIGTLPLVLGGLGAKLTSNFNLD